MLSRLSVFVLVAAVVALLSGCQVSAQTAAQNDLNTLNYALTLEHLENIYYQRGLALFNQSAFAAAGFNSTVFTNLQLISLHEANHVNLLRTVINTISPGAAVAQCNYTFNFTTVAAFLTLAAVFENTGQSAYGGALNFITDPNYQQVAATIATIEARHAAFLNVISNYSQPFPNTLDPVLKPAAVIAAITPFLGACPAPQLAVIPTTRPSGRALNNNGTGTNITGRLGTAYTPLQASNDVLTLKFALIHEKFEVAFYQYVFSRFSAANFSAGVWDYLQLISLHENMHVGAITTMITLRNGTVYPNCTFNFTSIQTPAQALATASALENAGQAAYNGAVNTITDTNLQEMAAQIATVEARQGAILYTLVNGTASPYPSVNDSGLDAAFPPQQITQIQASTGLISCPFTPVYPQVLAVAAVSGDPAFTGFHSQHFQIHGIPNRLFNILSTSSLQVTARFKMIIDGEVMTAGQMKQARLMSQIKSGSSSLSLPVTTAFSHAGTFLGEIGIKLDKHRLYLKAGRYTNGMAKITLDNEVVPVSSTPVTISSSIAITRPNPHTLVVDTAELSFSIVNSDNFFNIEQAQLNIAATDDMMIDGLLGQTANPRWTVQNNNEFKQHMIMDYLVADDDIFSDDFVSNVFNYGASKQAKKE